MTRINLLPVRAAKKKETAIQQIGIAVASVTVVLVIVLGMWTYKKTQIVFAKKDIDAKNAKIEELKKKIGKLEEVKTFKEQVKKKLDVLSLLRKNKTGPAQRLSTISETVPDKLWLESYRESNTDIKMTGVAYNEELIAMFMRAVEASFDFEAVELIVSEQRDSGAVKLKRFEITCRLEPPKKDEPQQPKPQGAK